MMRQQEQARAFEPEPVDKAQEAGYTNATHLDDVPRSNQNTFGHYDERDYTPVADSKDTGARPDILPRYSQVMKS